MKKELYAVPGASPIALYNQPELTRRRSENRPNFSGTIFSKKTMF